MIFIGKRVAYTKDTTLKPSKRQKLSLKTPFVWGTDGIPPKLDEIGVLLVTKLCQLSSIDKSLEFVNFIKDLMASHQNNEHIVNLSSTSFEIYTLYFQCSTLESKVKVGELDYIMSLIRLTLNIDKR